MSGRRQPDPRLFAVRPGLYQLAQQAEQRGNRVVRDLWDRYRCHRERVTAEILAAAPEGGGGRVCLLGAGNANDVDLEQLAARFDEIHLVDLDPAALARAAGRQPPPVSAKLRLHAPVELSGIYRQLEEPRPLPRADALVNRATAEVVRQLPAGFDVVASCCVLNQMSWALERFAGPGRAPLPILQQALVRIHLRSMLGLIRPAGAALLIADLVSSELHPLDELRPGEDLAALTAKLAAERIATPVGNPELVRMVLRRDPELARASYISRAGEPWLWSGPSGRTYLVYSFELRRYSKGVKRRG